LSTKHFKNKKYNMTQWVNKRVVADAFVKTLKEVLGDIPATVSEPFFGGWSLGDIKLL